MAGYLNFRIVKNNKEFVVGETPCFNMIEAKLSLVEKNYSDSEGVSFYNGGYIFTEFSEHGDYRWEYYSYHIDCYFIKLANLLTSVDKRGYDDRSVLLFNTQSVLEGTQKVYDRASKIKFEDLQTAEEELLQIKSLIETLKDCDQDQSLVMCSVG